MKTFLYLVIALTVLFFGLGTFFACKIYKSKHKCEFIYFLVVATLLAICSYGTFFISEYFAVGTAFFTVIGVLLGFALVNEGKHNSFPTRTNLMPISIIVIAALSLLSVFVTGGYAIKSTHVVSDNYVITVEEGHSEISLDKADDDSVCMLELIEHSRTIEVDMTESGTIEIEYKCQMPYIKYLKHNANCKCTSTDLCNYCRTDAIKKDVRFKQRVAE